VAERLIATPVNVDSVTCTMVNLADPDEQPLYRLFRREAMTIATALERPMPAYVHPEKLVDWLMVVQTVAAAT